MTFYWTPDTKGLLEKSCFGKCFGHKTELYLGPCQTSTVELFCENRYLIYQGPKYTSLDSKEATHENFNRDRHTHQSCRRKQCFSDAFVKLMILLPHPVSLCCDSSRNTSYSIFPNDWTKPRLIYFT